MDLVFKLDCRLDFGLDLELALDCGLDFYFQLDFHWTLDFQDFSRSLTHPTFFKIFTISSFTMMPYFYSLTI